MIIEIFLQIRKYFSNNFIAFKPRLKSFNSACFNSSQLNNMDAKFRLHQPAYLADLEFIGSILKWLNHRTFAKEI